MRLLATKKLDFSFKQRLLQQGFSLLEVPFIQIEKCDYQPRKLEEAILVSSKNAAKLFLEQYSPAQLPPSTRFFCVGQQSAQLLKEKGAHVLEIGTSAADLAHKLIQKYSYRRYSYACGSRRMPTLESTLSAAGIFVDIHELYHTHTTSKSIQNPLDGILFYSPSAVLSFMKTNTIMEEHCFCIGPTTAKAVQPYSSKISIAKAPDNNHLFLAIMQHYHA